MAGMAGRRGRREGGDVSSVAPAPAREAGAREGGSERSGNNDCRGGRSETLGTAISSTTPLSGPESTGVEDPAVGSDDNDAMMQCRMMAEPMRGQGMVTDRRRVCDQMIERYPAYSMGFVDMVGHRMMLQCVNRCRRGETGWI
jgi:hypothetical protein